MGTWLWLNLIPLCWEHMMCRGWLVALCRTIRDDCSYMMYLCILTTGRHDRSSCRLTWNKLCTRTLAVTSHEESWQTVMPNGTSMPIRPVHCKQKTIWHQTLDSEYSLNTFPYYGWDNTLLEKDHGDASQRSSFTGNERNVIMGSFFTSLSPQPTNQLPNKTSLLKPWVKWEGGCRPL